MNALLEVIVIADSDQLVYLWFKNEIFAAIGGVKFKWIDLSTNDEQAGLVEVHLSRPTGLVLFDQTPCFRSKSSRNR